MALLFDLNISQAKHLTFPGGTSVVKIAFIGAGSYGFTVKLVADILSFDELRDSELTFMDVDPKRMERVKTIVNAYLKKEG